MKFSYYEIVCILSIFQLSLLSAFLITHKSGKKNSNRILAVFLLAQLFAIFDLLCFHQFSYVFTNFPYLFYIGFPFRFLWAPTLYIYVRSLTSQDFRFTLRHGIHALPSVTLLFLATLLFHIHSSETKQLLLERQFLFNPREALVVLPLLHIQIMAYITASLIVLRNYNKKIRSIYSSLAKINLSWLKFILYGYTLSWLSSILFLITYYFSDGMLPYFDEINITAFLIFFNIIFFKGLTQPAIFLEEKVKGYQILPPDLSEQQEETYLGKLLYTMDAEKPFLNSELTINELGEKLDIPSRHLSHIINARMNKNFFDFISDYRIEEAKKMLSDDSHQHKTILEILYDAGFNSKSSFNSLFKKKTGMTPSEYRKKT